jgi:uncharacterized protein with GYD domain
VQLAPVATIKGEEYHRDTSVSDAGRLERRSRAMPTYVILLKYTEQGARTIRKTVERARQSRALMNARGVNVLNMYWTQGHYDLVAIAEAPDEEAMMAAALRVVEGGNVSSETMRAFSASEMETIIQKL